MKVKLSKKQIETILADMTQSGALKAIFESHGVAYAPAVAAG